MQKFNISGMSCAACAARIEKAVSKVKGVESCAVNLLANSMSVEGSAESQKVIDAVVDAGYGASALDEFSKKISVENKSDDGNSETQMLRNRLVSSLCVLVVLMYFSMGHMMFKAPLPSFFDGNPVAFALVQFILSAFILLVNRKFFISGTNAFKKLSPNMDSLVALGSGISFLYSTVVLFMLTDAVVKNDGSLTALCLKNLYFEGAAMIVTLITVGKLLESVSKGKTTNAVKSLMEYAPSTAIVERDGIEVTVAAGEILAGETIIVKNGAKIPADGTVMEGHCSIDESSLTGESIPVEKKAGSKVFASTLCTQGFMKVRAEKVGQDTGFSKIIQMVMDASSGKAPVQRIADKVSGVFVPVVISIALLTFFIWILKDADMSFALSRAVAVLVISCPCALGLAVPVAIMAGCGVGARNGILFKSSAALENAGRTKIVCFDKTGTLTKGIPEVTDVVCYSSSENELLSFAASLESRSSHPLARAVMEKTVGMKFAEAENYEEIPGSGIKGTVCGKNVLVGNSSFVTGLDEVAKDELERLAGEGKTPLLCSVDGKLIGIIAVADSLKEDAAIAIEQFRKIGVETAMITGDNEITAKAVGKKAGILKVFAGVKPDEKSVIVAELKKKFGSTAMTGDGVNDAVALTSADTGIAIGAGTDVAIDAASVVLVKSRVLDCFDAIRLSRSVLRVIHQNLFWAFIYNMLGIPLAAGVFHHRFGLDLNPMVAAACMSLSSFCVVTNALRLNLFRAKKYDTINEDQKIQNRRNDMEKTFNVEGMMCSHCEAHVREAVGKIAGVTEVVADHNASKVTVKLSADVDDSAIKAAIEGAGYKVN
ncbi:heavy metal translocating P-type ATPase [Treponema sp.]|uniref:heavy metal translocating P-type ATPase n=1 Tax=Treponema sp. TaxID=166 RepID=UPI003890CE06